LRSSSLFNIIAVTVANNKIVVREAKPDKTAHTGFARFGVDNLQNLIKLHGRGA
jgi:hypothetical protein